ncbi:MAG: hypothetical protein K9K64_01670 [Desulfohalobiaceae bacterium]|nr:hypothetical protein [Desulfohalobiaceae bacterium]
MKQILSRYDTLITDERRRTVRIKRSGIQANELEGLDRPAVKFAENRDELAQAFSLVYEVYFKKKYIKRPASHGMLYSIYSLLPETTHIVAKSYLTVISTLTEIFDSKTFGLPMDGIYRKELDRFRNQGRKIVELSTLATPREHRWKNIFHYLVQVMYWYSVYTEVDDVCIAVNPRHVRYYKNLFPFEIFGPERKYARVEAPAVGLRGKVREAMERMMQICKELDFDTPLYAYFYRMTGLKPGKDIPFFDPDIFQMTVQISRLETETVQYFIDLDPSLLKGLSEPQKSDFLKAYPGLRL